MSFQRMCFKLRHLKPCVLSDLSFTVDLPDEDEINVSRHMNIYIYVENTTFFRLKNDSIRSNSWWFAKWKKYTIGVFVDLHLWMNENDILGCETKCCNKREEKKYYQCVWVVYYTSNWLQQGPQFILDYFL